MKSPFEPAPDLAAQARVVSNRFRGLYGGDPAWIVAAPGRVNLIGEHTDYNDGFVFPMAIDRYVVMAGAPASGEEYCVHSMDLDESRSFFSADRENITSGDWANYIRGVVDGCQAAGLRSDPLNLVLQSAVPNGGGLSSSAALEVATATLIEAASGRSLDPRKKALIAQKAEHDYAGVPCGIMDQFASALSREDHLMLLDCRSGEPTMVPFTDKGIAVLIINSNVRHELTGGEYAERRKQCEAAARHMGVAALRDVTIEQLEAMKAGMGQVEFLRARHVVTENARTVHTARCFERGDWETAGQNMTASHVSLRDDFEVSCPELNLLVELALEESGVYGSRMTGGGFGGCTVTLLSTRDVAEVSDRVARGYQSQTGIRPTCFVSRPARGAFVLS